MRQEGNGGRTQGEGAKGREKEELPLGAVLLGGMFCLILLLALVTGSEAAPELWALFLAYATGENLLAWRKKRTWPLLFLAGAEGILAVMALVEVGSRMLGVPH